MTRVLWRRTALSMALCALAASAACDESSAPPTDSSPGTLVVVVNATGMNIDQQFLIHVNEGEALPYVSGTPFERKDLPASLYTVRLAGVASNCAVQGSDTVQIAVYAGLHVQVTFNVACQAVAAGAALYPQG